MAGVIVEHDGFYTTLHVGTAHSEGLKQHFDVNKQLKKSEYISFI